MPLNTPRAEERVLIVDDEPNDVAALVAILEDDYEVLAATDGAQALELARAAQPDLILLDVMMPGMDGYQVCARLKGDPNTAGIPIIFVTGLGATGDETHGLEAGAVDYVTKPIVPLVVRKRVRNHVRLKKAHDRLTQLTITDSLTGLANRRRFDQALDLECRRLRRTLAGRLSLLLLDIDQFKAFNDTYGHVAGDHCLRVVAEVIAQAVHRATDLTARFGGEEFACILPETGHEGALIVAERIRAGVAGLGIRHAGSTVTDHVTVSLGLVSASSASEVTMTCLLAAADAELYRAKTAGRDCVRATVAPRRVIRGGAED